MKTMITTFAAGLLAVSFTVAANAAPNKQERKALAQQEASCKAQAEKKFSAIHFLKRRDFVNSCMGRSAQAKAVKSPASTTGSGASTLPVNPNGTAPQKDMNQPAPQPRR